MSGIWKPKRTAVFDEDSQKFGICIWKMPDGSFIKNDKDEYFSAQGVVGSLIVEQKMRDAVRHNFNITSGEPMWLNGFRKTTQSEWEDQMERLLDGKVPDPVDLWRQETYGE